MKKRYFSCIALLMIFCMLILAAGCGVRINGKDYTIFEATNKDKNSNIIQEIADGIGSESTSNDELTEEVKDGEVLNIDNNVGNFRIDKSNDSKIVIEIHKKVKGISSEDKKNILDNMNVSLKRDGKNLNIEVRTKDGADFWQWQKQEFHSFSGSIDFDISIPGEIKEISTKTGAGNIDIKEVNSLITAKTGAGNVTVEDVSAYGNTEIKTGTGNIRFSGKIDEAESFTATTGVGNVDFSVPQNTKMSLDAGTGVGHLSGYFVKLENKLKTHFSGDINGGGSQVKLNTGVGNMEVNDN